MRKYIFTFALFPIFLYAEQSFVLQSQVLLDEFFMLAKHDVLYHADSIQKIVLINELSSAKLLKQIRKDIRVCYKKAQHDNNLIYQDLCVKLQELYKYIDVIKICYDVLQFHKQLKENYYYAWGNLHIVHDIQKAPHLYGLEHNKHKYKTYVKQINKAIKKLDLFEKILDDNYQRVKAQNYVYRIELIKIRNHIYHHARYKYETYFFK
jgi:hypothetical protein